MEKMMKLKFNKKEFMEILAVSGMMIGVLLPIRILFITFIGSSWLGSFGSVSAVAITMLYLSKKNKLGWFGRAFLNQMFKINKGKRKYFSYFIIGFGIFFTGSIIYASELGNTLYQSEKTDFKALIPEDEQNMNSVLAETGKVKVTDFLTALFAIFYLLFFRFDFFAVLVSTMNDISNNFISHMATIMLVEQLELAGILIYFRISVKQAKI